jgi:hypothetical protein
MIVTDPRVTHTDVHLREGHERALTVTAMTAAETQCPPPPPPSPSSQQAFARAHGCVPAAHHRAAVAVTATRFNAVTRQDGNIVTRPCQSPPICGFNTSRSTLATPCVSIFQPGERCSYQTSLHNEMIAHGLSPIGAGLWTRPGFWTVPPPPYSAPSQPH